MKALELKMDKREVYDNASFEVRELNSKPFLVVSLDDGIINEVYSVSNGDYLGKIEYVKNQNTLQNCDKIIKDSKGFRIAGSCNNNFVCEWFNGGWSDMKEMDPLEYLVRTVEHHNEKY